MKIARFEGERVFPADFPNTLYDANTCADSADRRPYCPECGDPVTHVSESIDGREAHFSHCPDSGGAGGGGGCAGSTVAESDEHRAMKSIAVERLEAVFAADGLTITDSGTERHFAEAGRTADGFVEFASRDEQLGSGVVVEVQYKHKSKDVEQTMRDYHNHHDFAVLWLRPEDFDTESPSPEDWRLEFIDAGAVRGRLWLQTWPPSDLSMWDRSFSEEFRIVEHAETTIMGLGFETLREDTSNPMVPAQLPQECVAEYALESWRDRDWESLFNPPPDYTDIWAYAKVPAELPTEYVADVEQTVFRNQRWQSLFTGADAEEYIHECRDIGDLPSGYIRVTLPEISVMDRRKQTRDTRLERPSTPFNDIQCWNCGKYWHHTEQRMECQSCGTPVDFAWNVQTGRIEEIPDYAEGMADV